MTAAMAMGQKTTSRRQKSRNFSIGALLLMQRIRRRGGKVPSSGMMVGMRETGLQRVVAIDWSGRMDAAGQRRHIWAGIWTAIADGKGKFTLEAGRTRQELMAWL